ncbi:MAG: sulfotransferase, partial [Planctomycetia bacterium]|nr:sulfotransferase [Planctomycetia bacterium]
YDLPLTEQYRVVFMERDMEEVLDSQEKMLRRLDRPVAPRDEMTHAFTLHLNRLHKWLAEQPNFAVLRVRYADVVTRPREEIARVNEFLSGRLNVEAARVVVDPSLYRNKKTAADTK